MQGDPVEIGVEKDGNADMCCLCNQGGSLLCCDKCPATYHMRCIGEQAKSLPEGEWACPECAVGGRGEHYFSVCRCVRTQLLAAAFCCIHVTNYQQLTSNKEKQGLPKIGLKNRTDGQEPSAFPLSYYPRCDVKLIHHDVDFEVTATCFRFLSLQHPHSAPMISWPLHS